MRTLIKITSCIWRTLLAGLVTVASAVALIAPAISQEFHAPLSVWQGSAANNDQAISLHNRGYAYARLGYYLPAIEAYDAALSLAPNWASVYANRAMAFREIGEPEKALSDVEQSIALDQAMVRRWQEWLTALGYHRGSIDGAYGPQTATAILHWAHGATPSTAQPAASN